MWAPSKTIEKRGTARGVLPLEKYLSVARGELVASRRLVPVLEAEIGELRDRCVGYVRRFEYRMRRDCELAIERLRTECDVRRSMVRENEFEETIAPYLKAYNERVDVANCNEDGPRNICVPGVGRRRESIDAYVQQTDMTACRQSTIINEYLMEMDGCCPKLAMHTRDECPLCHESLMLMCSKALMTCGRCGYAVTYLDATMTSMSYSDDVEFSSFSYKRINHFMQWLQQVQAKETFEMEQSVMEQIMEELHRQRVVSVDEINQKKVRDVLKILKLRKAYEHVAQITSRLTGVRPMRISAEAEETCRLMFIAVQPSFEKHCPKDRKNFLSYSYCLYKFFQLLGYDAFLESFALLKGRDKLARQDDIFKRICEDLDWQFISSL